MKDKSQAGRSRFAEFIAGKGFYIVLILCLAVIGVSVWTMINLSSPLLDEAVSESSISPETRIIGAFGSDESVSAEETAPAEEHTAVSAPTADFSPQTELPTVSAEYVDADAPEIAADEPTPEELVIEKARSIFIRPVSGELIYGYSGDDLTYSATMGDWRTHRGVDLYAVIGAEVKAAGYGTVSDITDDALMGTTVTLDHGDGLLSIYSNLEPELEIVIGQELRAGDVLGAVGSSAIAESGELSHLHFAMKLNGRYVNPAEYVDLE